jgi:hypothetical protein
VLESFFHQIDVGLGLLTRDQWEAWRGWATTLGGLVALGIAVSTYRLNVRLKNEEQARQVYSEMSRVRTGRTNRSFDQSRYGASIHKDVGVWQRDNSTRLFLIPLADWVSYRLEVNNTSSELIGPAYITSIYEYASEPSRVVIAFTDALKPESSFGRTAYVPLGDDGSLPTPQISIAFRDSGGRWWSRTGTEPIRPSKDPRKSKEWRSHVKNQERAAEPEQAESGPPAGEPPASEE